MQSLTETTENGLSLTGDLADLAAEATEQYRELHELEEAAQETAKENLSENTRRTYQAAWEQFTAFCERYDMPAEPASPQTVVLFLQHLKREGYKFNTLDSRLTGISVMQDRVIREISDGERPLPDHLEDGATLTNPCRTEAVRKHRKSLRRAMDVQPDQKEPLLISHLRKMEDMGLFEGTKGARDRALLLLGFAGAFRRSELTSLNIEDVHRVDGGIVIHLRSSKTDQDGEGTTVSIPDEAPAFEITPNEALDRWLQLVDENSGPLFCSVDRWGNVRDGRLSGQAVYNIVTDRMEEIGEPPARYGAHSLRAGLITQARSDGVDEGTVAAQSRHSDMETFRDYVRPRMGVEDHFLSRIGNPTGT